MLVLACAAGWTLLTSPAAAQRDDLLTHEACRINPSLEECICRDVRVFSVLPRVYTYDTDGTLLPGFSENGDPDDPSDDWPSLVPGHPNARTQLPMFDEERGVWVGDPRDLEVVENTKYKAHCSMAYFRENLRRAVYVLATVGAVLFGGSVAWAGFVHMQETASGESRSTARTVILRSGVGMILLAMAFVAFEAITGLFLEGFQLWDFQPGFLEQF